MVQFRPSSHEIGT
jgi:hypothetical protein